MEFFGGGHKGDQDARLAMTHSTVPTDVKAMWQSVACPGKFNELFTLMDCLHSTEAVYLHVLRQRSTAIEIALYSNSVNCAGSDASPRSCLCIHI